MKTAVYFEDGATQIVLTPESKFELRILEESQIDQKDIRAVRGGFYQTRGEYFHQDKEDSISIMLVMRKLVPVEPQPAVPAPTDYQRIDAALTRFVAETQKAIGDNTFERHVSCKIHMGASFVDAVEAVIKNPPKEEV